MSTPHDTKVTPAVAESAPPLQEDVTSSSAATEDFKAFTVGGVPIRVFGLDTLPKAPRHGIAVLYLLHGRTETQDTLRQTAVEACQQSRARKGDNTLPLICVTFDQRNHGARTVDAARNGGLRDANGEMQNPTHAVDMVAIIAGTAADVSLLLDFLPAVVFPTGEQTVMRSALAGVSLGGHVTWTAAARDVRLTYLCPILSSPSLLTLLTQRKAPFPSSLGNVLRATDADQLPIELWAGRNVLVLAGADDALVPHEAGGCRTFIDDLQIVSDVDVFVQPGTGHTYTDEMKAKLLEWLARAVCTVAEDG